MTPIIARNDFEIVRGDDYVFVVRYKINGTYQSMTGATIKMTMRQGDTQVAQFTTTGGAIVISTTTVTGDTATITMDHTTTAALSPGGQYKYDVQITKSGIVTTILMGKIRVIKDVTTS